MTDSRQQHLRSLFTAAVTRLLSRQEYRYEEVVQEQGFMLLHQVVASEEEFFFNDVARRSILPRPKSPRCLRLLPSLLFYLLLSLLLIKWRARK